MNTKFIAGGTLAGLIVAGGIATMVSAQTVADATGLTEEQVIEIALTEVPGDVTEVELETHRGKSVYEVDILGEDGTETEVEIAADTGEILKVEVDGECDDDQRGKHRHGKDHKGEGERGEGHGGQDRMDKNRDATPEASAATPVAEDA